MNNYDVSMSLLPHAYPFLLIDKIVELEVGEKIICLKNVSCNEDVLLGCSPKNPYFPSTYIIEAMAQTSGLLIDNKKYNHAFLSMIKNAKFYRKVEIGDQLIIASSLFHKFDKLFAFEANATVNNDLVAEAEITLAST